MSTHRPFEAWILGESRLGPKEAEALRGHLERCEACRSLAEAWPRVDRMLRSPALVSPRPGFARRWALRRAATTVSSRPRTAWGVFAASLAAAAAAAVAVAWELAGLLASPSAPLQAWIRDLVQWSVFVRAAGDIAQAAARTLPSGLLGGLWLGFVAATGGLMILWIASLHRTLSQGVSS